MCAPVAALGGIGHRQDKPFIPPRDRLQAQRAGGGDFHRFAGQVGRGGVALGFGLDQPIAVEHRRDMRHSIKAGGGGGGWGNIALGGEFEIKQAVGVIEGWPKYLTPGQVFERGRDAARDRHLRGLQGGRGPKARQGRAVGADQKDRLDQIAARLFDRQGGQIGVIQRPLGHHAVHSQSQLLADLRHRQFGHRCIATPLFGQPRMGGINRFFAPFDGNIHQTASTIVLRGRPATWAPLVR